MDFIGTFGQLLMRIENETGVQMTDKQTTRLLDYYDLTVDDNFYTEDRTND